MNLKKGPKVFVLFTDFSKNESDDDSGNLSYDEEEEKTTNPQDSDTITFEKLVNRFREDLVNRLIEDQCMEYNKQHAQDVVDILLPSENFFAYKVSKNHSDESKQFEMK